MKKTLIFAAAAAAALTAQGADLLADWNGFTNLTSGSYTLALDAASTVSNGILSVDGAGSGTAGRPTIDLTGKKLTLTDGLTISLLMKGSISDNTNIIGIAGTGNYDTLLAAGVGNGTNAGKGTFFFRGGVSNAHNYDNSAIATLLGGSDYSVLTITTGTQTVDGTSQTVFTMYLNGQVVGNGYTTDTNASSPLTALSLGGWAAGSSSTSSYDLARFALYDGAMDATEVAALATSWTTKAVPEPATATLSLLALAGLAVRRRRK